MFSAREHWQQNQSVELDWIGEPSQETFKLTQMRNVQCLKLGRDGEDGEKD